MDLRRALPLVLTVLSGTVAGGTPAQAQTSPVVTAARIAAVRVVVEHHIAPQREMLRCLALTDPRLSQLAMGDWRELLSKAGDAISAAGISGEQRRSLLAPLTVEALTGAAGQPAETKAGCEEKERWQTRWGIMQAHAFPADVREVLTGRR